MSTARDSAVNGPTCDPITGPMAGIFANQMRGAQDIDHPTIRAAGHFLQEDAGEELAEAIVRFLQT